MYSVYLEHLFMCISSYISFFHLFLIFNRITYCRNAYTIFVVITFILHVVVSLVSSFYLFASRLQQFLGIPRREQILIIKIDVAN